MSTGLSRAAYLDAVRKNEGIPFVCEPCRADALESLAMPVRDSTHITGDKRNGMDSRGLGWGREGREKRKGSRVGILPGLNWFCPAQWVKPGLNWIKRA